MPRPRNPVTPTGRLDAAWAKLALPAGAFPDLAKATRRAVLHPDRVIARDTTRNAADRAYFYRYTDQENADVLAFSWMVHTNHTVWTREQLRAACTVLSVLYVYSSTTLAELTGIPASTVTKAMLTVPGAATSRVTGAITPEAIHTLLLSASEGSAAAFRRTARELALRGTPQAQLARITGIPRYVLLRPDRGLQFFPEDPDLHHGVICTPTQADSYWKGRHHDDHHADPGDQGAVRRALHGEALRHFHPTQTPVARPGRLPAHAAIPGCPLPGLVLPAPIRNRWEQRYQLPAPRLL